MLKKVKLRVEGMACMGCVATVIGKLRGLAGVEEVKTSLVPPEAEVTFDPEKVTVEKMVVVIDAAGYKARPEG